MIGLPSFSSNSVWFPVIQEPDEEKRDRDYYLRNVKAFYFDYYNDGSLVGFNNLNRIQWLRSFAEGRQYQPRRRVTDSDTKKEETLDENGNRVEVEREEYPVIDFSSEVWDILSPANKIMNSLVGNVMRVEYEINADPIDYATIHKTEEDKLRRWSDSRIKDKVAAAAKMAGIEMPEPQGIQPETPEDLELANELGEFAQQHVKYIEQIVKHTFDISHWSPDIKMLFYRDLFTYNRACIKNDYDPEDGKVKPTYVDIAVGDTQKSMWIDCRDNERWWHFYAMPISTLKQYFPEKPAEWFEKLARNNCGQFDNPSLSFFDQYTTRDAYGNYLYEQFKTAIGNFEWVDINIEKEEISEDRYNRRKIETVSLSSETKEDKKVRFKEERIRYAAKWVLGTDDIFEWGPAYDQTFPSKNDAEGTYQWIVLPGKSIIEQLIPIFKNFQDLWTKFRELLRNAQGRIIWSDADMLASTAGEKDTPQSAAKKAFRRMYATDRLMIRRGTIGGGVNQNQPAGTIEGGMGELFAEIMQGIELNIKLVEYITGVNALTTGSTADPNLPVTTAQLAFNSTSATIRPYIEGYMRMQQMVAENAARWICVLIRGNEYSRNAYKEVIGDAGIKALMAADKDEAAYGIRLIPRPNDVETQYIIQNLERAVQPDKNGDSQIAADDADRILNMIVSKTPIKTVQAYFKKARERQRKIIMDEKKQLMDHQAAVNKDVAAQTAEKQKELQQMIQEFKLALQGEINRGGIAKAATTAGINKEKEIEVEKLKQNAPEKEPQPA